MRYNQHILEWYWTGRMDYLYRRILTPRLAKQAIAQWRRRQGKIT